MSQIRRIKEKENSNLTLVVLAAGMGSRYGGLKQIDRLASKDILLIWPWARIENAFVY